MAELNEKEFWLMVEQRIQDLLNRHSNDLDDESKEAVIHYLEHSEYEMAFEGLFIELMKLKAMLSKEESSGYIELGEKLGLNEESVFDADFWQKFSSYCSGAD